MGFGNFRVVTRVVNTREHCRVISPKINETSQSSQTSHTYRQDKRIMSGKIDTSTFLFDVPPVLMGSFCRLMDSGVDGLGWRALGKKQNALYRQNFVRPLPVRMRCSYDHLINYSVCRVCWNVPMLNSGWKMLFKLIFYVVILAENYNWSKLVISWYCQCKMVISWSRFSPRWSAIIRLVFKLYWSGSWTS